MKLAIVAHFFLTFFTIEAAVIRNTVNVVSTEAHEEQVKTGEQDTSASLSNSNSQSSALLTTKDSVNQYQRWANRIKKQVLRNEVEDSLIDEHTLPLVLSGLEAASRRNESEAAEPKDYSNYVSGLMAAAEGDYEPLVQAVVDDFAASGFFERKLAPLNKYKIPLVTTSVGGLDPETFGTAVATAGVSIMSSVLKGEAPDVNTFVDLGLSLVSAVNPLAGVFLEVFKGIMFPSAEDTSEQDAMIKQILAEVDSKIQANTLASFENELMDMTEELKWVPEMLEPPQKMVVREKGVACPPGERINSKIDCQKAADFYLPPSYSLGLQSKTCALSGKLDILSPTECARACATGFSAGSWSHSPRCFKVVSGPNSGACHWNNNSKVTFSDSNNRALCKGAVLDGSPSGNSLTNVLDYPSGCYFNDQGAVYFNTVGNDPRRNRFKWRADSWPLCTESEQDYVWLNLLGATATQSSTQPTGEALKAIDGVADAMFGMQSCTHTGSTTNPWWQVDLGNTYHVQAVSVTNSDASWEGLNPFNVHVNNILCASQMKLGKNETKAVSCIATGDKVKVSRIGVGNMQLCDVRIGVEAPVARYLTTVGVCRGGPSWTTKLLWKCVGDKNYAECKEACDADPACGAFDRKWSPLTAKNQCCLFKFGNKGNGVINKDNRCYVKDIIKKDNKVKTSYFMAVQHDLASQKTNIFGRHCMALTPWKSIKKTWLLQESDDESMNSEELQEMDRSASTKGCYDWNKDGRAIQVAWTYSMTQLGLLQSIAELQPAYAPGINTRLKKIAHEYAGLYENGYRTHVSFRMSLIQPVTYTDKYNDKKGYTDSFESSKEVSCKWVKKAINNGKTEDECGPDWNDYKVKLMRELNLEGSKRVAILLCYAKAAAGDAVAIKTPDACVAANDVGQAVAPAGCNVTIWEHGNFNKDGGRKSLGLGKFNYNQINGDNKISSVKVVGPCYAEMYKDKDWKGNKCVLSAGEYENKAGFATAKCDDDEISSIWIKAIGTKTGVVIPEVLTKLQCAPPGKPKLNQAILPKTKVQKCEDANKAGNYDNYQYVYNEGRGTPAAVCGLSANCDCCRRCSNYKCLKDKVPTTKAATPILQSSNTQVYSVYGSGACRAKSKNSKAGCPGTWCTETTATSLQDCESKCTANSKCKAIEYNIGGTGCELWTKEPMETSGATDGVYVCKKKPLR